MANTGATTAGASQLREGVDLSALNKSSAKVATFVVRLVNAKDVQYTYRAKRDGTQQTANKFEIVLVGMDPKSYCIGYVKGSEQDIAAARKNCKRFGLELVESGVRHIHVTCLHQHAVTLPRRPQQVYHDASKYRWGHRQTTSQSTAYESGAASFSG